MGTSEGVLERRLKLTRTVGDPALRAVFNLDVAGANLGERLEAITMAEGLSKTAYNILRILRGHPEGHPRGDIAQRLVYRRTDVTRLVDGLVRRGLAMRVRTRTDRRLSLARITPKGLKTLERLEPSVNGLVEAYREKFTQAELAALSQLLERCYDD